jgi:glycosyltransferase involved in cell wall biosynthesis
MPDPSRKWRIALASMAPFVGGAEVALERLAVGLREAGQDVFVILGTRNEVLERMEKAGLRCLHAPMYFTDRWHLLRYWKARNFLRRLLRREQPDLVHSNDLPTHQMVADAAGKLGIPRICHHRFPFPQKAIDWLNKFGAERHLFVSRALMDEMCGNSARLRGSPRGVVHDGLALPAASAPADRLQARTELGLPPDRVVVTFAGQIIPRKGVADLLRAWSLLAPAAREGALLLIVGDDIKDGSKYRREMEGLAAQLGCGARFVGFQKSVDRWLCASDLAVVPSHVEPLGNATLEAMAQGLPVIGCAVGGIPEMIESEQNGLLVPPRDPPTLATALGRLLGDAQLRQVLGARARQRCEERFSLAAHVRSVLQEYERVLRQPTGVLAQ